MLGLFLQGENLDSDLEWLDPVTAAIKRRFLPESIAVEESRRSFGVGRWLVWIWSLM